MSSSKSYLSNEQVRSLIGTYQSTGCKKTLAAILDNYQDLCRNVIRPYIKRFEAEDLYQDAMLELIHSIKEYSLSVESIFSAYAMVRIKRSIRLKCTLHWGIVSTPQSRNFIKAFQAMGWHDHSKGMSDTEMKELAKSLDVPIDNIKMAYSLYINSSPSIINVDISEETLPSDMPISESPENIVIEANFKAKRYGQLHDAFAKLTDRDRQIILARHLADKPETLQTLGERYGVSCERIRQLEARGLKQMRQYVA